MEGTGGTPAADDDGNNQENSITLAEVSEAVDGAEWRAREQAGTELEEAQEVVDGAPPCMPLPQRFMDSNSRFQWTAPQTLAPHQFT